MYTTPVHVISPEQSPMVQQSDSIVTIGNGIGSRNPEPPKLSQHQVVTSGEQKGCVYVFDPRDGTTDDDIYIVVQVRHCRHGLLLLPTYTPDGSLSWAPAADPHIPFATYLAMIMETLTGDNWKERILPHLRNVFLVRYQAVVKQEDWREIWDTLLKPWGEQREAYNRIQRLSHKGRHKPPPDMFFGVEALPMERSNPSESNERSDPSRECRTPDSPNPEGEGASSNAAADAAEAGQRTRRGDGIPLPGAAAWLEFWQNTDIPHQNTFVDFVTHVNESGFLRRVSSSPDVFYREEEV
jgi:hypothetical protein